jgi:autotransporter-associated beta strand protein
MQLSGAANTYTGPTTINAGTLKLGATATILGSTPVTVSSGALLDASAIATGHTVSTGKVLIAGRSSSPATDILGNLVLAAGTGAIKPAGDGTVGTLTVDGNLTLNGGTITVDQAAGTSDLISLSGASRTLTLSGTNTIAPALGYLLPGTYTLISGFTSSTGTSASCLP